MGGVSTVLPDAQVLIDFGCLSNHHGVPLKRMSTENETKNPPRASNLLRSGIIFAAINFGTSLGYFAFQALLGRHLKTHGDYGSANSAIGALIPLLGLIPAAASIAVTHYIAHFNHAGDHARLQGLLAGCRKFLLHLTVGGTLLALIVIKPLSDFFHYSESLMLATLVSSLFGLWSSFAVALCQGLAWFNRLALIGFLTMVLRFSFGWLVTLRWPSAETAVLATAFSLLASLLLLCWRKELSLRGTPISPWNRQFIHFLIASLAFTAGNFCFFQCDLLIAQHHFPGADCDAFTAVGILARALPATVSPLLVVLFTSRSGGPMGDRLPDQLKLLGLSAGGLVCGAVGLFVLRTFCLKLIGRDTPEAAANILPFAVTMVFVGLLQSLAFWVLASRWLKTSLLYGALGLGYWLVLLFAGCVHHAQPVNAPDSSALRERQLQQGAQIRTAKTVLTKAVASFAAAKVSHTKAVVSHCQEDPIRRSPTLTMGRD